MSDEMTLLGAVVFGIAALAMQIAQLIINVREFRRGR